MFKYNTLRKSLNFPASSSRKLSMALSNHTDLQIFLD